MSPTNKRQAVGGIERGLKDVYPVGAINGDLVHKLP